MPNWCQNSMLITGAKEVVERLMNQVKGEESEFDFNGMIPIPKASENDWYDWNTKNWGTKWNACDVNKGELVKVAGQELYQLDYYFETAWSYPEGVFKAIAQQYPELVVSIDVDEEGGFFWGNLLIKNGQVIESLQEGTRPGGPYDYGDEDDDE